jgi:hypothetical protein
MNEAVQKFPVRLPGTVLTNGAAKVLDELAHLAGRHRNSLRPLDGIVPTILILGACV